MSKCVVERGLEFPCDERQFRIRTIQLERREGEVFGLEAPVSYTTCMHVYKVCSGGLTDSAPCPTAEIRIWTNGDGTILGGELYATW